MHLADLLSVPSALAMCTKCTSHDKKSCFYGYMPMVLKVFGEALKDEEKMSRAMLASIEVPKVPLKRPHN